MAKKFEGVLDLGELGNADPLSAEEVAARKLLESGNEIVTFTRTGPKSETTSRFDRTGAKRIIQKQIKYLVQLLADN
ncbi:hypothetical protein ACFL13_02320 [Patescibacteria group bacterium]